MSSKIFGVAFLALVVVASFFFLFNKDEQIINYPVKNTKIVAFGDSLVEGVGASSGNDFISQVERKLGIKIENMGRSGDTTLSGLERLGEVIAEDPGIVILLLGGNDVLRRIPKEETFQNLETIIKKLEENKTLVILLGIRGGILSDGYEDDFEKLAKKYKTLYVSNVLKNIITKRDLMYDGIHPNDKGYAIIADRVGIVLEKAIMK
ncbi:arylesterase [Candidatus Nomurabacteria bacterium]|nr:arylesterase [Candidatus Nomurabacteria bacterium]